MAPRTDPRARLRLFCFPYAGGGPSLFRGWQAELGPRIDVRAVQLPGRESRMAEPPLTSLAEMAETVAEEIRPLLDRPFAFFGYSLGSLIAFEVARRLRKSGMMPAQLMVAALGAPHLPHRGRRIHALPPEEFAGEIRKLNGTPESVLRNRELMSLLLPVLQADFQAYETYRYQAEPPLECAISALGGAADSSTSQSELAAWSEHTSGGFRLHMLPGGHFFLHSAGRLLTWAVFHELTQPERVAC